MGALLAVLGFLDWFVNRFRASNNFRLAFCWVLTGAVLLSNLVVFGFGQALSFGHSEEAQRHYNLYFHGRFATNAELATWAVWAFGGMAAGLSWFWGWLRWFAWIGWFGLLLFSVVYTPVALRDEFSRAWRVASRRMRERRGAGPSVPVRPTATPPGAAPPPPAGAQPLTLWQYLTAEFIGDMVQELLAHLTIGRR